MNSKLWASISIAAIVISIIAIGIALKAEKKFETISITPTAANFTINLPTDITVSDIGVKNNTYASVGGTNHIEDNVVGGYVTFSVTTNGGVPPITVTCDPPSGRALADNHPPHDARTIITCKATDGAGHHAEPKAFPVLIFRSKNCADFTNGSPDHFTKLCGLKPWHESSPAAPVIVRQLPSNVIDVKSGLVRVQFKSMQNSLVATLYHSPFMNAAADSNAITEELILQDSSNRTGTVNLGSVSASCDATSVSVEGPVNCNTATVRVSGTTQGYAYTIEYNFLGDGKVKNRMEVTPPAGKSFRILEKFSSINAASLQAGSTFQSPFPPLSLAHDPEYTNAQYFDASKALMLSVELQPAIEAAQLQKINLDFCLTTSQTSDGKWIAEYLYGLKPETTSPGACVQPFSGIGTIDIDPSTAATFSKVTLDEHVIQSKDGSWGVNTSSGTLNIGNISDLSCSTGTGPCIQRGIVQWNITGPAIPATATIDGVYMLYSTSTTIGSPAVGKISDITINPSSAGTTNHDAWFDAGNGTVYVSSWSPASATQYNSCPTNCQDLGTNAVSWWQNNVRAAAPQTWFAIGLISEDTTWPDTNKFNRVTSSETGSSWQKPVCQVNYH